jgi:hypothetical protein
MISLLEHIVPPRNCCTPSAIGEDWHVYQKLSAVHCPKRVLDNRELLTLKVQDSSNTFNLFPLEFVSGQN